MKLNTATKSLEKVQPFACMSNCHWMSYYRNSAHSHLFPKKKQSYKVEQRRRREGEKGRSDRSGAFSKQIKLLESSSDVTIRKFDFEKIFHRIVQWLVSSGCLFIQILSRIYKPIYFGYRKQVSLTLGLFSLIRIRGL